MAENIYSKGTRVWFEDKDQAWISAEVTSFIKGPNDTIKLIFLDERGKVSVVQGALTPSSSLIGYRK
jgi:myosin-5